MDEIRKKIEQINRSFYEYYRGDQEQVNSDCANLLELCELMLAQLEIQAEQLDRLADAVPSAGAYEENVRAYLNSRVSRRNI